MNCAVMPMLELCNIGHLGFLVVQAGGGLLVDPLLPGVSEYRPAPHAVLDEEHLRMCTALILTSSSPLQLHRETLERTLDGKTLLVPAPLRERLTPAITQRAAGIVSLQPWEPYDHRGVTVLGIPADRGRDWGVVVTAADAAVWFQGRAVFAGATAQRVLRHVPDAATAVAVISAFLETPLQILQGQARGFPFVRYHQWLVQTRATARMGWQVAPVGGIGFSGRASWLNTYAMPVSVQQMATDVRRMLPGGGCLDMPVGQWVAMAGGRVITAQRPALPVVADRAPAAFDPSTGMPAMLPAGHSIPDLQNRLEATLHRLYQHTWWSPYAAACQVWALRLELRVQGEDAEHSVMLHLDAEAPRVSPQPCDLANMRARITASGIGALLEGRARAAELALCDHLRVAHKVHHVYGSAVRQPSWWGEDPDEVPRDRIYPLLPCWTLLDQLGPTKWPLQWLPTPGEPF